MVGRLYICLRDGFLKVFYFKFILLCSIFGILYLEFYFWVFKIKGILILGEFIIILLFIFL